MSKRISIVDVIRWMNIDPESQLCWTVGALAREQWRNQYGTLPEKQLRPKTDGSGGSHCLAVYPISWRARIAKIVSAYASQASRQGSLGL
jgi:hypothetical protein